MSDSEHGDDIETMHLSTDTEEVQAAVERFRDAAEELGEAAENLEDSAVYITDSQGNITRIEATELLDLQIQISVDVRRSDNDE